MPTLIIGTVVSTFLIHPQPMLVKGLFGPIAFIVGLLTLITLDRKGGLAELPAKARLPILLGSLFGGMITGWVAIGEGEIIAAYCMLAYKLNANQAIGLGVVLLSLNSILLAVIHAGYFGHTLGHGILHHVRRPLGRTPGAVFDPVDFISHD